MSGRRLLAAVGDVTDRATWSGTPYHLLSAAVAAGFLQGGLGLCPAALGRRRLLWNLGTLLKTGRWGGYQYSEAFLERLFAQAGALDDTEILSHFPLLPPPGFAGSVSFYIDATLKQNFEDYGLGRRLSRRVTEGAVQRERDAYQRAQHIVCMSHWAANSVRTDYGIAVDKIHVARPGANLDELALANLPTKEPPPRSVLRLGFVGKDWRRKGLPLLLSAAERIQAKGQPVRVIAVGPSARELPSHPLLEPVGFVDKLRGLSRFVEVIRGSHFGCLLSRVEALGISTLEFLRLGVPVVGLAVGGIADCITPDVGLLLPPESTPDALAGAFLDAWTPTCYERLCEAARARAPEVTWTLTVRRLEAIWSRST